MICYTTTLAKAEASNKTPRPKHVAASTGEKTNTPEIETRTGSCSCYNLNFKPHNTLLCNQGLNFEAGVTSPRYQIFRSADSTQPMAPPFICYKIRTDKTLKLRLQCVHCLCLYSYNLKTVFKKKKLLFDTIIKAFIYLVLLGLFLAKMYLATKLVMTSKYNP